MFVFRKRGVAFRKRGLLSTKGGCFPQKGGAFQEIDHFALKVIIVEFVGNVKLICSIKNIGDEVPHGQYLVGFRVQDNR